MNYVKKSFSVT